MPSCTSQSVRCDSYRLVRDGRTDGVTHAECTSYVRLTSTPRLPRRPPIIVANAGSRSSGTISLRYLSTSCRGSNKTIVSHPLTTRGKKVITNGAFEEASTSSNGHSPDQGQGHGIEEKTNGGSGWSQTMGDTVPEPSPGPSREPSLVTSLFSSGGEMLTFQGTPPQQKPFVCTSGWEVLPVDAMSLRVKPKSMVMESAGRVMLEFEITLVPGTPSGGLGKAGTLGSGLGVQKPSEPPQRVGLGLGMGLGAGVGMGEVSDEVEELLARVMEERVEEMERVFEEDLSSVQAMAAAEMSVMRGKLEGKEALQSRLEASLLAIDVLKELVTALMDEGKAKKNTDKASTR